MRVLRTLAALVGRMFGRLARLLLLWSRGPAAGEPDPAGWAEGPDNGHTGALDPVYPAASAVAGAGTPSRPRCSGAADRVAPAAESAGTTHPGAGTAGTGE